LYGINIHLYNILKYLKVINIYNVEIWCRQLAILYKDGNNINKGLVKEYYSKHYEGGKKKNGSI